MVIVPRLPILATLRTYKPAWLGRDLSAGMAIAAVGLPSAIAYPAIAGLPPETGLYASIFAAIGYAIFGPSDRLITGPDAATMIMLAAVFASLGSNAPGDRVVLAAALAVLVGGYCILARLLRFDVVASFLSRPILTGFMTGIALSILIGQIGRFTGVKIESEGLLRPLLELARKLDQVHVPTLLLASGMLALLLVMKRMRSRVPGPVAVVVLAVVLSLVFNLQAHGIRVVGDVPNSLPHFQVPLPSSMPLDRLVINALAVWFVSFSAGIISARAFGVQGGYRVDADKELTGFAAANVAAGFFGGFPVTASDSRTAINMSIGGKTRLAGLASAVVLVVILLFLNDLLRVLPVPALGAILVAASLSLMDFGGLASLWRVSRMEFLFALIGLVGPIAFGVLSGVMVAIAATFAYLLYCSMDPRMVLLGRVEGAPGFHKLHRVEEARAVPGLTVCLLQGSLLFYNSDHTRKDIEAIADEAKAPIHWLVLDGSSMNMMDTTAAATLVEIRDELAARDIRFGIAELHSGCLQVLVASGAADAIGRDMIFDDLEAMLRAYRGAVALGANGSGAGHAEQA
jgi:high affinity sulfate transporter 1